MIEANKIEYWSGVGDVQQILLAIDAGFVRSLLILCSLLITMPSKVLGQSGLTDEPLRNARLELQRSCCFLGYPNGYFFQGAFQGNVATRFLILKAAIQSKDVANALELTESQLKTIRALHPVEPSGATKELPDEQSLEAGYFEFLDSKQLERLDALAIRFDGLACLSRKSMANRLQLSVATQQAIGSILKKERAELFAPRLQDRISESVKPKDHAYRECLFDGQTMALVNLEILGVLNDEECNRLFEFGKTMQSVQAGVIAIESMAPLPDGILSLRKSLNHLWDE